jgi:hypothetical protein
MRPKEDVQILLLTESEYQRAVDRFEKHGLDNALGFLCVVDVGTGDTYVDESHIVEDDTEAE